MLTDDFVEHRRFVLPDELLFPAALLDMRINMYYRLRGVELQ